MKNFNLLVIVLLVLAGCNKPASYKISGSIAGLDSGAVYLVKAEAGKPVAVDTSEITDGKFLFEGQISIPELHYLRINERDYFAQFFLENEKIEILANKDSLRSTKVSGSPQTDVFNVYIDELNLLNEKARELQKAYSDAMSKGNQDAMDRARIEFEASSENMQVFAKNFVREHSGTVVAPFITLTQLSQKLDYDDLKELVDLFPAELESSVYTMELNRMVEEMGRTAVGVNAPEFTMNDQNGSPVSLSSFKGKYLLIDFWASWCAPCRQENPNVVRIYNEYKDKGFEILGVSLDRDKDAWLKAIEDDNLSWTHVSDLKYWQNEVARLYGVNSIPHTVLLDKEGRIVANKLRGADLENKLKELLQ
ncbi:redoxin domain-containing protein [Sunxiuqinia sp. A32]|uniref:redoxin domain-containing protein n=1 Tax=Sunxiuqinia sp. A32 TaxID=3461496 RepID=UPI004045288E